VQDDDDEVDLVKQMLFTPIGRENPRPHLLVSLRAPNWSRWSVAYLCHRSYTSLGV
jgi:hypothetical protein